tara:strand:- start:145 stop:990 length:846 start_codon:yes stop_codon:yes gene_type:complete
MAEDSDEVKIEIKAPPKAIEIQTDELVNQSNENQQVASEKATGQTATLTGGITQMTDANILQASPENVKFVMGPNGQIVAMHKPPFEWKDFLIGGGIPFALIFIPILILIIGSGLGYHEYNYEEIELTKEENGTAYQGEFALGDEDYLQWCNIFVNSQDNSFINLRCEVTGDRDATIYTPDNDDQTIGYYNVENGTLYLDSGIDYETQLYFSYEYSQEDGVYLFFESVSELAGFTCCLGLLLSIVFLIVGFSQGKPGMGWGGVSALISFPIVSIVGLAFMW